MDSNNIKRIVIVGDGHVGKTSIVNCFVNNYSNMDYNRTIFDSYLAHISHRGVSRRVEIWDTSGQEKWASLRKVCYPDSDVVVLTFDVSNRKTLNNIIYQWYPEVLEHCPKTPFVLVGNKTDLRDGGTGSEFVLTEKGQHIADVIGARSYVECCAMEVSSVASVFDMIGVILYGKAARFCRIF